MTTLRLGIVGLGVISRFYLAALDRLPGFELVALCDLDERRLEPFRDRVRCYPTHRELLADGDVDAVVVNVPNDVHAEVCRDALATGRAVCVEKPLATTLAAGRELVELARSRSVTLFTAFHRRYNSNVVELVRQSGQRPPVRSMTVRYLERIEEHVGHDRWYLDPERCGGGCVADNGPNSFDLVHLFLGPSRLTGASVRRDTDGLDRQAVIDLATRSEATARVELDWSYEHGECKDITVTYADGSTASADMLTGYPGFKSSLEHEYVGVLNEFREAVLGLRPQWPDGLAELELVTEIYRTERVVASSGGRG